MLVLLIGLGGLAAGGLGLALSRRAVQPPAGEQVQQPPASTQTPASSGASSGNSGGSRNNQALPGRTVPPSDKDKKQLEELGEMGVVAALGAGLGFLASVGANDTKEAKAAAPAIGAGVALAAYLANVGGVAAASGLTATLGAFAVIALPILEVTYAIVVIVDQVLRFAKSQQWRELAIRIRQMREAGQFREALQLYVKTAPNIEPIARIWPQPKDDWYNPADQLGRPYPGFPGPPAPATAEDVKRWPQLAPDKVGFTPKDGGDSFELSTSATLDAAYADVVSVRDALLQQGTPGYDAAGKLVTTGPRDVRAHPDYVARKQLADGWARAFARSAPWLNEWSFVTVDQVDEKGQPVKDLGDNVLKTEILQQTGTSSDALVRDVRLPVEVARDEASRAAWLASQAQKQAAALTRAREAEAGTLATDSRGRPVRATAFTPSTVPIGRSAPVALPAFSVQMAAAQGRDTTAQQRTGAADRAESGADGARTGGSRRPANNSGSGGRNT